MQNEYVISDFSAAILEKDRICTKSLSDRWTTVSYKTAKTDGVLLVASETCEPGTVTVDPGLSGWYRIYVCMTEIFGANRINLRLSDDEFPTTASHGRLSRYTMWMPSEKAEEALWKCADMTGQKIEISKARNCLPHTANILWLRFVAMSECEAEAEIERRNDCSRKTMFAHMDGDFHGGDDIQTPKDYCKSLYAMKDSDVGIVSMEVINDLVDYASFDEPYAPMTVGTIRRMDVCRRFSMSREETYPMMIDYAHKCGMRLFAGHRMQLSSFAFPLVQPLFTLPFVDAHPEFRCMARDGCAVDFLSYGYSEVQDYVIANILESMRFGFDGVHLIFDRGQHLLFEDPVKKRYEAKYGEEKNFYRLPLTDARLTDIKAEILTEFLEKLRRSLSDWAVKNGTPPLQIYITTYFSHEDALQDGFDMARFAKAGVIDGFIQAKMCVWEDTEGVVAEDGYIDLQRYTEKADTEYVIRRDHSSNMDRLLAGIAKYREIADRYGVAFYSENQWECAQPAEAYVKAAKRIYEAGSSRLALWDCYPARVQNLGEWAATARLGKAENVFSMPENAEAYHGIVKILSYGGREMRYYNPSWRG